MASKNISTKTTAERFAGLLKDDYAKKTEVEAVLGTTQDTSSAATVYGARALANEKVASITAGGGIDVKASSPNSSTAPAVSVKLSAKTGNDLSIETGSGEEGLYFHQAAAPTVSVIEKASPNTGYLKSYQVTVDSAPVGIDIDIPKDFLVKSATSGVVTAADKAAGGKFENNTNYTVGDAYLDFVINVKSGTATDEHVYVNVSNLVDAYTAGNGRQESNSLVSNSTPPMLAACPSAPTGSPLNLPRPIPTPTEPRPLTGSPVRCLARTSTSWITLSWRTTSATTPRRNCVPCWACPLPARNLNEGGKTDVDETG